MKPERSIGVCADLIIEIEQRVELLVLKNGSKKILENRFFQLKSLRRMEARKSWKIENSNHQEGSKQKIQENLKFKSLGSIKAKES